MYKENVTHKNSFHIDVYLDHLSMIPYNVVLTLVLRLLVLEKRAIKKIFIGCSNNEKIDQRSQIVRVNISE